ncbi:GNAT family N-acetyltransferase [Nakamurella sp. YIM 132087]|uniref:GNAT family N-acetyltransferase n=2 Tax=Nakamurella alba TaxID=2665158 RepID=A0A7K1FRG6_9ACTN|nr:GNAT family N-acetyltransferase [Nakamurella alba]
MAHGWQGVIEQPLGEWVLRYGNGFTNRANSVLPLGDPGMSFPEALAATQQFYAEHDRPPVAQIPVDTSGLDAVNPVDDAFAEAGWAADSRTHVMTIPLADLLDVCPPVPGLPAAEFEDSPSAAWLDGYLYRGAPLPPSAIEVLVRADRPVFAAVRDEAGQAGVARGVVHDGLLGVTAVTVDVARRRSGVAGHLMGELARWAAAVPGAGVHTVYLQVDVANTPAVTLYRKQGFVVHHDYHYRRPV